MQSPYEHNEAFRYECLLKLGDSAYYPDFTIKHPKTGKTYYWEHFGQKNLYARFVYREERSEGMFIE